SAAAATRATSAKTLTTTRSRASCRFTARESSHAGVRQTPLDSPNPLLPAVAGSCSAIVRADANPRPGRPPHRDGGRARLAGVHARVVVPDLESGRRGRLLRCGTTAGRGADPLSGDERGGPRGVPIRAVVRRLVGAAHGLSRARGRARLVALDACGKRYRRVARYPAWHSGGDHARRPARRV